MPLEILYDETETTIDKEPIIPDKLHQSFKLQIESVPTNETIFHNAKYSYTGMTLKLKRKSLGHLASSYYYPTASFALLSMISYFIKPDIVSCFIRLDDYISYYIFLKFNIHFYLKRVLTEWE